MLYLQSNFEKYWSKIAQILLLLRYTFGSYQSLPYPLHLYQKNTVVSTVQYKAVFCNAFILHRIHNKAFSPLLQQNVNEGSKKHNSVKNEKSAIFRRCSAVYLKRQNINRGAGFLQMVWHQTGVYVRSEGKISKTLI